MNIYISLMRPGALLIYLVAFFVGSLYAQIFPTLSVFLVDRFAANALDLGGFFVALAASSIVVSQAIGNASDRGIDRLKLIVFGLVAGGLACILFAYSVNYWMTFAIAVFVFAFASITVPQIMAYAREYAEKEVAPKHVALFNAVLRAGFAFSWIAGPPIGFLLQKHLGTEQHYLLSGFLHFGVVILVLICLPRTQRTLAELRSSAEKALVPIELKLAFVAVAILFGLNQSYMIALPQFIGSQLGTDTVYAGYIMGTAAGLEIPVMLFGGWLASRFRLSHLIRIGAFSATILYAGMWISEEIWHLFALQTLNAVFIGMVAGLGLTWFQNQVPKHAGFASSLFGNAINLGVLLGSISIGTVAAWLGYRDLFLINVVAGGVAVFLIPSEAKAKVKAEPLKLSIKTT